MSLLDDVSIVVTPNGYKAGELYAVVPVPTEGADVVVDGDFPLPNTAWSLTNATVEVNGARVNNTIVAGFAAFSQLLSGTVIGKQFVLTYDVIATNGKDLVLDNSTSLFLNTSTTGINRKLYYTWGRGDNYLVIKRAVADTDVTIDNVILQEYTAADMDVTRASAATRVDENGLVNYAEIVGSEEVTNGDFATDSDWSKASNWTISGGSASSDGVSAISNLSQTVVDFTGKTFLVEGVASNITQGFAYISLGGSDLQIVVDSNGAFSHTISISTANSTLFISARNNFIGSIDNVSVKEVTRDNVPRIDYSGGGCPHILAEPMRTNLVTYSEDFTTWTTTGSANVTSNTTISPDGTQNADTLDLLAGDYFYKPITSGAGTFTLSCYVKVLSGTLDFKMQSFSGTDGANASSVFTANTNWQRFEFTTTVTVDSNFYPVQVSGLVGGDFEIWGAQLELGSYPTSMIPTSGSTVTRNQDQFSRDGISSLINSTEGVLFVEMAALANDSTNRMISLYGSGNDKLTLFYKTASNSMTVQGFVGGSLQINRTITLTDITQFSKIALRYKTNDFAWYVDGVKKTDDTSTNTWRANTLTKLSFDDGSSGNPLYAKVKQLKLYKEALTNSELITLTTI